MDYFANPAAFQKNFIVPASVVERHLKLATQAQLKVLLYVLSHLSDDPSNGDIAACLSMHEADVADALKYWELADVFVSKNTIPAQKPKTEKKQIVKPAVIKPTREEIARRGAESEEVAMLLREAQLKFGRALKLNESSTILWLFDDQGMDISLILMLLEYAKNESKCNVSFIERTATEWLNNNISSITDAENYIAEMHRKKTAWKIVEAAFGIEDRLASTKELELAKMWVEEWEIPRDMLRLAYEKCVDSKSKFVMSYTAKILENWHKSGYKTANEVLAAESNAAAKQTDSFATSDVNAIEEMLNRGYRRKK